MKMIRSTVGADNAGLPLYWSESDGWVEEKQADVFPDHHPILNQIPADGEIVEEREIL